MPMTTYSNDVNTSTEKLYAAGGDFLQTDSIKNVYEKKSAT